MYTIALFEKIRAKYDHKEDIWLIGDNAGYYTSHKVQEGLEQNVKEAEDALAKGNIAGAKVAITDAGKICYTNKVVELRKKAGR